LAEVRVESKFDRVESGGATPNLDLRSLRTEASLRRGIPYGSFEYVDVVFNAVADTDTDIRHSLSPGNPEDIDWEVVQWRFTSFPGGGAIVYKDIGATRRPWGDGYVILRCNIDSAQATLRLSIRSR
jgi:hypothetical protein